MPEPEDDSMLHDTVGPITWPKVAALLIIALTILGACLICGIAPGWQ